MQGRHAKQFFKYEGTEQYWNFHSIYLSSSFLKFYLMVVHNGHKVFLHVYYITDVSSYIHICANIYTMCITFVHMFVTFYISQRCMFGNILLRGIHNQKSLEISGGDLDGKE